MNSSYEGWLVFNVTVAMETWKADQTTNRGLFIQVHTITGEMVTELPPDPPGERRVASLVAGS